MSNNKKPFYCKWWFILITIIVIVSIVASIKEEIGNASEKKVTYTWPDNELASMIPQPDSKNGKIMMENKDYFSIDIYKVSKESFEKYVEDCRNSGFTVDYMKQDDYYSADNESGYSLMLHYDEKGKTLGISLNNYNKSSSLTQEGENNSLIEQKESEATDAGDSAILKESSTTIDDENESKINEPVSEASGDIRSEFKEVLDAYEAFMNEYCEFMKKYNDSDDTFSMAMDYIRIIQEEIEWIEKIDNLENEEMNAAEAKYYGEVTLRVSQKLLEAAQ